MPVAVYLWDRGVPSFDLCCELRIACGVGTWQHVGKTGYGGMGTFTNVYPWYAFILLVYQVQTVNTIVSAENPRPGLCRLYAKTAHVRRRDKTKHTMFTHEASCQVR